MLDYLVLGLQVLVDVRQVPVHHGTGDCEVDSVSFTHSHDLDVLAYGRNPLLQVHKLSLGVVNYGLRLREGRIAYAEGRIVGGWDIPAEDIAQVRRAHSNLRVQD